MSNKKVQKTIVIIMKIALAMVASTVLFGLSTLFYNRRHGNAGRASVNTDAGLFFL